MRSTDDISKYVKDLLTVAGFDSENTRGTLYEILYHEYMAVALYELMSTDDKETLKLTERKLKWFFCSRFFLKDKKKKIKENQENTPTPPKENKEKIKEKEEKTHTHEEKNKDEGIENRMEAFREECYTFIGTFDADLVTDFYNWYSQEDKDSGKMLFECQRFWNTKKRLVRWSKNHISADNTNAKIRLQKTKKTQAKEAASMEKQQMVAEIRMSDNERREKQQEESKRNQMLTADYLAKNPDGLMAKWARERKRTASPQPPPKRGGSEE
jgi:hypothetical protein